MLSTYDDPFRNSITERCLALLYPESCLITMNFHIPPPMYSNSLLKERDEYGKEDANIMQ